MAAGEPEQIDTIDRFPKLVTQALVSRLSLAVFLMLIEVAAERVAARGLAQLGHRLDFDLPDPFPGDSVDVAELVQGVWLAVGESEAQPDNAGFPLG
jgi:hypothetical protein